MTTPRRNAARFALFIAILATAAAIALVVTRTTVVADEWLPVPPADLAMKDNPAEPGADAMILYRSSHVDARNNGLNGEFDEEYYRVKIFTTKGAEKSSDVKIAYWKNESDIKDIRARTIEPDGTVVNFGGQVFEKPIDTTGDSGWMEKVFSLSQVQPGSVIEYKYRETFMRGFMHGQDWRVSGPLFMRDAYFSIEPYSPRVKSEESCFFRTINLAPGLLPQLQRDGSYKMEVHNLNGIATEPLMPPVRALEARVEFFYRFGNMSRSQSTEDFWNNEAKSWSGQVDKFVDKKSVLDGIVSQTIAASDTPDQKLRKLYTRAQQIPNLSYQPQKSAAERKQEEIKPNENVEDVIKHNYAWSRQVNWFFIGLARAAGFEADAVYIVPRNRDVFSPAGQNTSQLSADLVWVKAGDREYWLDPAALYYPFGYLPWPDTESKGVRISKKGGEMIETPSAPSGDASVSRTVDLTLDTNGGATGRSFYVFTGVSAAARRTLLREADETGRKKHFSGELQSQLPRGSTAVITRIGGWDDTANPLTIEATISVPNFGSVVGRRILFPAALFRPAFATDFESETRVNAIRFPERFDDIDVVTVHAPDGYTTEATPQAKDVKAGTSVLYQISSGASGATVEVKRHFALGEINFPRDQYAVLRNIFLNIKTNDEAQIVVSTGRDTKPATTAAASAPSKN